MDFEWVAIALGDVTWILVAFILGFAVRLINLPPLVGFLATGFLLNAMDFTSGEVMLKLADLGITLLLFTVGLKLNLKVLVKPHVWSVTIIHMAIIVFLFGSLLYLLAGLSLPLISGLELKHSLIIAFALSFSSTVFVVKVLEDKGEINSLHGRIAVGILVMQDLAAVIFLAASTGTMPSYWSPVLLLLFPLRPMFHYFLKKSGHGELLILYGLVLALGGAELFETVGVKDDLGALFMGILISSHSKSQELAKSMLSFKDLFLVGFFLSIGMTGELSLEVFVIGLLLVPFILVKSSIFFLLMTRFKLRARTSLLAAINLNNYSEFGLIVAAIAVSNAWILPEWLAIISIALSISFVASAPLNNRHNLIYSRYRKLLCKFQSDKRLEEDESLDTYGASIAIFGMGRTGRSAYDKMKELRGDCVVGVDFDEDKISAHNLEGRRVLHGDPSDADFWDKVEHVHSIKLIMLALPNLQANLDVLEQLNEVHFSGNIAATARYPDEIKVLQRAGVTAIFNMYTEAGVGFANLVEEQLYN